MEIFKVAEWENISNIWYVGLNSHLSSWESKWWVHMRILDLNPKEYIQLLIKDFNAHTIKYFTETDTLIFSFHSKKEALQYKNYINKKAKEKNFFI